MTRPHLIISCYSQKTAVQTGIHTRATQACSDWLDINRSSHTGVTPVGVLPAGRKA